MLSLTCCACGAEMPTGIVAAIDSEFERREEQEAEGYPIPVAGILCLPCEIEVEIYFRDRSTT